MKDFLDQLDERLQALAVDEAEAASPARATRPARRMRRPAILAGATSALGAVVAAFALTTASFADLPILDTPTTDATQVRRGAASARAAGVDFSAAHVVPTPNGPGYVFTTPGDAVLCLTVPAADGTYPGACAPRERVERSGLVFELVEDRLVASEGRALVAFVLPEGASDVTLTPDGGTARPARVTDGVVAESLEAAATLAWTVDGTRSQRTLGGPFRSSERITITCPDGRLVAVPAPAAGRDGAAADAAARRSVCR